MEIYQLKTFVTVAEEGHLTRAAERLNTSQPAVSAHIKALEETLGIPLFKRTPKGMVLTEEGRILDESARKVLDAKEAMERKAQKLRKELTGTLRIGLNSDPQGLNVGPFATWIKSRHPGLNLEYLQSVSGKILLDIKSGLLDCGYFYGSCPHREIAPFFVREVELAVAGPASWADSIRGAAWHDIAALPWIGFPAHCPYNQALSALVEEAKHRPSIAMLSDNESTINTMVQAGIGLSVMLKSEAIAGEAEGRLAIWDGSALSLPLSFGYLKKREDDPMIKAALEGIQEIISD